MYQPGITRITHRMIQTNVSIERMARHAWPYEQRTHDQHKARHGGEGVDTGDDDHTAIVKPAPQKMANWATYYRRFAVDFRVSGLRYEVVDMWCSLCSFALNFLDVWR